MRLDLPWFEMFSQPPKPPRFIEDEVAPGRLLFAPRRSVALFGMMLGMGGASTTLGNTAHRGATAAASTAQRTTDPCGIPGINCFGRGGGPIEPESETDRLWAVLPPGRRLDPTQ